MALKIIALCLACFSLGFSVCSIVYQVLMLHTERDKCNNDTGKSD